MYNGKKAKASTAMAWLSVLLYECEMQLSLIAGKVALEGGFHNKFLHLEGIGNACPPCLSMRLVKGTTFYFIDNGAP